ncbi:MAG TPA: cupin domain-containing protein [Vicinamibacterales bacterium]|nr:cupin domain-containing protein [Vicinamibacterales bacterium]
MRRIILALSLTAIGIATAVAQQPGTRPQFTGTSTVMDGKDLSAARRSFDAGARTYWHSHDNGQFLMVEKGTMRTQKHGEKMRELKPGESDYTAPNVVHWHGAAPNEPLVQINVGFGGGSKWYEAVTDAQYNGK